MAYIVGMYSVLATMAESGIFNNMEFEGRKVETILKDVAEDILELAKAKDSCNERIRKEEAKNKELEEKMKEVGEIKAAPNCKYYMPCGLCEKWNSTCQMG